MQIITKYHWFVVAVPLLSACAPHVPNQQLAIPTHVVQVETIPSPSPVAMNYAMPAQHIRNAAPTKIEVNREVYQSLSVNPVHEVSQAPVSTFSVDVDTGSYSNVRRYLAQQGRLPPVDAVRIEEFINYFDYHYALPRDAAPFAVHSSVFDSPWKQNAKLLKIALQAKDVAYQTLPPANLVFLIDVSGSMDDEYKLPLVKQTLRLLTEQIRAQDKVTIISYASGETLLLEAASGKDKAQILKVINALTAQGATSGERAIQQAYETAQKHYLQNGINRIFLVTDGDFNVGVTDFNQLKDMVAEKRQAGVSLTTLGFGTGNYNERLMEQLADAGDGNYSYIDSEKEAQKVLQRQLSSTLATVAQDVKVQVEFNPTTVKEYRLIGYENRMLQREDFNNDQVDAGDIGAGHRVTALYEIIPVGQQGWLEPSRYSEENKKSAKTQEYAFVKLRYKQPNHSQSRLLSVAVKAQSRPWQSADADTRWAVAASNFAQLLQGGKYSANMNWQQTIKLAEQAKKSDPFALKQEMIDLMKIAQSLSAKKAQMKE